MSSYLEELFTRMCHVEHGVDSKHSVSWKATREAERLSDCEIIQETRRYLEKKRNRHERDRAYFVIGKVGKNTGKSEAVRLLLDYVATESDKYALSTALEMISELPLPDGEDVSVITKLLQDHRWRVRHSAIRALQRSTSVLAEEKILELLANTDDKYDRMYCYATLMTIGTDRSLPIIQTNIKSRKPDLKRAAISASKRITERSESLSGKPVTV